MYIQDDPLPLLWVSALLLFYGMQTALCTMACSWHIPYDFHLGWRGEEGAAFYFAPLSLSPFSLTSVSSFVQFFLQPGAFNHTFYHNMPLSPAQIINSRSASTYNFRAEYESLPYHLTPRLHIHGDVAIPALISPIKEKTGIFSRLKRFANKVRRSMLHVEHKA